MALAPRGAGWLLFSRSFLDRTNLWSNALAERARIGLGARSFQASTECLDQQKPESSTSAQSAPPESEAPPKETAAEGEESGDQKRESFFKKEEVDDQDPSADGEEKQGMGVVFPVVSLLSLGVAAAVYYVPDPPLAIRNSDNPDMSKIAFSEWNPVYDLLWRARQKADEVVRHFAEPSREILLPDMPPNPYGGPPPRTLVIDLDDTLVHSEWDRKHGWRTQKRPGVDAFLAYMAQFYEIVVFTTGLPDYVDPIIDRLDPYGYIQHRLYRDATYYSHGKHMKDLSRLNRDLSRVIIVDDNPASYRLQPENAIPIRPFKGQLNDSSLLDLVPFLESLVREDAPDVRTILKQYAGENIPAKFKERQKEIERRRKRLAEEAISSPFGTLAGFGRRPAPRPPPTPPADSAAGSILPSGDDAAPTSPPRSWSFLDRLRGVPTAPSPASKQT